MKTILLIMFMLLNANSIEIYTDTGTNSTESDIGTNSTESDTGTNSIESDSEIGIQNTNRIVSDSKTGLQWQDDYSDNNNHIKEATWTDALTYCETLTLEGHNDWRIPNFNELYSIKDKNPAINSTFKHVASYYYWSSTTDTSYKNNAWAVHFAYGNGNHYNKSNGYYVRCVRDKQ